MASRLPPRFLLPYRRYFSSTIRKPAFSTGPAPPRLPPKEQEEFERLQRASTGAFSTPRPDVVTNPTSSTINPASARSPLRINQSPASDAEVEAVEARVQATGQGGELHPDVRRGAKPEFEGDINPKTGEVGGPKNEPLRWGDKGDWSYNGRVTDF